VRTIRIGILGDFDPGYRTHLATDASLRHAAKALGVEAEALWVPTPSLLEPDVEATLESLDGVWASAGSPYKSMEGMLAGIRLARSRNRSFVAT
jgi:CTP synthase (UTP-ammonia lyase)